MAKALNLFPSQVAIGKVQVDGSVLMTQEFSRALADLLARVGGPSSMGLQELVALVAAEVSIGPVMALRDEIAELRSLIEQAAPALSLHRQIEAMRAELAMIEDPAAQVRYILTRYAPLLSPTFTGIPKAPTAAVDTNTTQLATTAFVLGQASNTNPAADGPAAPGTSIRYARADHVHPAIPAATITGSRGGNAALTSLLSGLAGQGLIINSTTA